MTLTQTDVEEEIELLERLITASNNIKLCPGLVLINEDDGTTRQLPFSGADTSDLEDRLEWLRSRLPDISNTV